MKREQYSELFNTVVFSVTWAVWFAQRFSWWTTAAYTILAFLLKKYGKEVSHYSLRLWAWLTGKPQLI